MLNTLILHFYRDEKISFEESLKILETKDILGTSTKIMKITWILRLENIWMKEPPSAYILMLNYLLSGSNIFEWLNAVCFS